MTPRFCDPSRSAAMAHDGYVVVEGLFREDVETLGVIYGDMLSAIAPTDPYFSLPMTGTNFLGERALRRKITARVFDVIAPRLSSVLVTHKFVGAGFRVKQSGPDSILSLHQDPTMLDESREWSMNIIVPLVDTTDLNGALKVVPGSHLFLPQIRSMNLNDRVDLDEQRIDDEIADCVSVISMKAGDAIFYFNALLHGSGPNSTNEHRPFVLGTIMSEGSPMVLYLRNAARPGTIERYEVPDDFFMELEDFDRDFKSKPKNGVRREDVADVPILSRQALIDVIRSGYAAR